MAFIVEQYIGDRGIQLGNEDFIRPMPWGTSWTKIRIGCRLAANGYSDIPSSSLTLYPANPLVGVCTGASAHASSDTVDCLFNSGAGAYTGVYQGSAPLNWYGLNGAAAINFYVVQKYNSTSFTTLTYTGDTVRWSANPTALRSPWYVDIDKSWSATGMTFSVWTTALATTTLDWTRGDFLKGMETEGGPANTLGISLSTALTRTAKDWNCVYVGWRRAVPTLCVYDLTVVRFF